MHNRVMVKGPTIRVSLEDIHPEIEILKDKELRGDQFMKPFLVQIILVGPEVVMYVMSLVIRPRISPSMLPLLFHQGHKQLALHQLQQLEMLHRVREVVQEVPRVELEVALVVEHRPTVSVEYVMSFQVKLRHKHLML